MHNADLALASEFPPATRADWLALVERTLKGARIDERLVARTADGIEIQPLYARDDAKQPLPRHVGSPEWLIAQAADHPEPEEANRQILDDLENGGSVVVLKVGSETRRGIRLAERRDLTRTLEGVQLDAVPIVLDGGGAAIEASVLLAGLWEERSIPPAAQRGSLGLDPLAAVARNGRLGGTVAAWYAHIADLMGQTDLPDGVRVVVADTRPYHAAGASEVQELAFAAAAAVEHMRGLEASGIPIQTTAQRLDFLITADADVFLTIAKLRAARTLWAQICSASGITNAPMQLSVETAWRMMSRRDPWVNMLRTTAACFAAAMGGAERVTVLPFTAAIGQPDGFARRIARNTQLILEQESHLSMVADPAAGSWYVEQLTREFAEAAWKLFQKIEAGGGLARSLMEGHVQAMVRQTATARRQDVAARRLPLTGVSAFPNLAETLPATLPPADAGERRDSSGQVQQTVAELIEIARTGGPLQLACNGETVIEPLEAEYIGAAFERLRDLSDRCLAEHGARPRIFLANLGRPADFNDRANRARNLFEAGGIEAIMTRGFASPQEAVEAFATSGTRLACICAGDDLTDAADLLAHELGRHGAVKVYVMDTSGSDTDAPDRSGAVTTLHEGGDIVDILEDAYRAIGLHPADASR